MATYQRLDKIQKMGQFSEAQTTIRQWEGAGMKKEKSHGKKMSQNVAVLPLSDIANSNPEEKTKECHYCKAELEASSVQCPDCNYPCQIDN